MNFFIHSRRMGSGELTPGPGPGPGPLLVSRGNQISSSARVVVLWVPGVGWDGMGWDGMGFYSLVAKKPRSSI